MNKLVKEGKELKEGFVTSKLGETIQSFVDNSLHSNELYKKKRTNSSKDHTKFSYWELCCELCISFYEPMPDLPHELVAD